jgi:hypothetical protein
MLHETLWGALAVRSRHAGEAIKSLFRGRAALKATWPTTRTIDPATLPYDQRVLDRIAAWREKGGYVVLVTATDVRLARRWPITSACSMRCTAPRPSAISRAPRKPRSCGGIRAAGLRLCRRQPRRSRGLVRGGRGHHRRRRPFGAARCRCHGPSGRAHPGARRRLRSMLRALRPHQWLKNLLVFVPIIADPAHGGWEWSWALTAFVALSLAASAGIRHQRPARPRPTTGPIRESATGLSRAAICRSRRARAWCRCCCSSVLRRRVADLRRSGRRGDDLFRSDHGLFAAAQAPFDHRHLHARRPLHDPHRGRCGRDRRVPFGLAAGLFHVHLLRARRGEAAGRVVGCRCRGPHRDAARLHGRGSPHPQPDGMSAGYVGVLVLALYIDEPRCRSASARTACSGASARS